MGLISKFLKKNREIKSIKLEDIDEFILKRISSAKELSQFSSFIREVIKRKEELEKELLNLAKADVLNVDARLASSALSAREQLTSKLQNSLSSIMMPSTYDSLNDTAELAFYVLKLAKETGERLSGYLNFVFEKNMKTLSKALSDFEKPVYELNELLKKRNFEIAEFKSVQEMLRDYNNTEEFINSNTREIEFLKKQALEKKKIAENLVSDIEKMNSSQEHIRFLENKAEIGKIEEKQNNLVDKFSIEVSTLEKPFRKYQSTIEKNHPDYIFIDNFFSTYISELVVSEFVSMLSKIRNMIEKGEIEIKPKQKSKVLKVMDSMSLSYLNQVLGDYNELEDKKNSLKKYIYEDKTEKELVKLESDLESVKSEIESIEKNIQEKTSEMEIKKTNLENKKSEIKNILEKSGYSLEF
ncbi:MAG: hypothetical protein PHW96_04365 [Candidatus Nanoarchaeia archaeon]|nr:hypothetical protein [Candidatus Nanoarchaeia archaeon]